MTFKMAFPAAGRSQLERTGGRRRPPQASWQAGRGRAGRGPPLSADPSLPVLFIPLPLLSPGARAPPLPRRRPLPLNIVGYPTPPGGRCPRSGGEHLLRYPCHVESAGRGGVGGGVEAGESDPPPSGQRLRDETNKRVASRLKAWEASKLAAALGRLGPLLHAAVGARTRAARGWLGGAAGLGVSSRERRGCGFGAGRGGCLAGGRTTAVIWPAGRGGRLR